MPRFVAPLACGCIVVICGAGSAQQGASKKIKAMECYAMALQRLAGGDFVEAFASAQEANRLRPKFKRFESLMAQLAPAAQRQRLRDYALAAGKDDEASIERLALYLKKGANDDEGRAWLLFCWITDRIAYDAEAFLSGGYKKKDYGPANVLKQRLAICDGYSKLYTAVGKEMGLDVKTIVGHSKGYGYRDVADFEKCGHSWNAVKIGGKWRLIEATWGAGALKNGLFRKKFRDYYFCTPASAYILKHYPDKQEEQFLDPTVSQAQFKLWPVVWPEDLLKLGFDPSVIRDKLTRNIPIVQAHSVPFPIKVVAPIEGELDVRKSHLIKVESLAISALTINHGGKLYPSSKRGDIFTCVCRGMEGDIFIGILPLGQKEYRTILKYRGVKGRGTARKVK